MFGFWVDTSPSQKCISLSLFLFIREIGRLLAFVFLKMPKRCFNELSFFPSSFDSIVGENSARVRIIYQAFCVCCVGYTLRYDDDDDV